MYVLGHSHSTRGPTLRSRILQWSGPASLFLAQALAAQAPPASGTRLRIWIGPTQIAIGTFTRFTRDSVTLSSLRTGESVSLAWTEITHIEEYEGAHGHGLLGGIVGTGFGAAVGAYFGSHTSVGDLSSTTTGVAGAVLGGVVGGLCGTVIGTLTRSESWKPLGVWQHNGNTESMAFGVRLRLAAIH
jgi:hypothetical protein